ncbi:MAG: hypothetical protein J0L88_16045 [Xanthomonadales bacterium]|nr:hypothetical protein [Xanthomonadales bacterium]
MHARDAGGGMNHDDSLGAALRALPAATPAADLWPDLARRLARPQRSRRPRWPFAMAASLLLGLVVARVLVDDRMQAPAPATTAAVPSGAEAVAAAEIDRVRARSRDLEGWLAARPAQTALDAPTVMAAAEVEDLVGFVDLQLSAARDDAESLPLWRQRVALLEDLALIRSTGQLQTAALAGDPALMPTSL